MSGRVRKMINKREWPRPFETLIVTLDNGDECEALYTGDGWLLNLSDLSDNKKHKVISYRYADKGQKQ